MVTRTALLALSIFALLPAAGAKAATTVGHTANEPTVDCAFFATGGGPCTAVGAASPIAGIVTTWRLRYAGAVEGDKVAFKTVRSAGDSRYTVVASTGEVTVPAGGGVLEVAGNASIAANDRIGAYVSNSAMKFIANDSSGSLAVADGNQPAGETVDYALFSAKPQIAAVVEADGDADGLGDETQDPSPPAADPGPAPGPDPEPGSGTAIECPAARPATFAGDRLASGEPIIRRRATGRATAREWRRSVIDNPAGARDYRDGRIEFDRRGRRHVIGHIINPDQVKYFGPAAGETVIDRTEFSSAIGLGVLPGGIPIVGYRRDVDCDQYRLAVGPTFTPRLFSYELGVDSSFQFSDVAGDPKRVVAHVAYTVGGADRLTYRPTQGRVKALPMNHVRRIRVAAAGGSVAVAASDRAGALRIFVLRRGRWSSRTLTRRLMRDWDMDLAPNGKPMVAWTEGLGRLQLAGVPGLSGKTGLDGVESVALAAGRRGTVHLAFTADTPPHNVRNNCFGAGQKDFHVQCVGKGFFYIRANRRGAALQTVQGALGDHMPISLAVHRRRAEVVFPEGGMLVSRRSR